METFLPRGPSVDVEPKYPEVERISGSESTGMENKSHNEFDHFPFFRSNNILREAFDGSVA